MDFNLEEILSATVKYSRQAGLAIVILIITYVVARLLKGIVERFGKSKKLPEDITSLLLQIAEVGIYLFGGITALSTLGIDMAAIIAGLGLIGFAVGFALKDLLSNFLSGLLILLYTPFVRGDRIAVSGSEGTVIEVNLRYTVLQSEEKKILIPNSSLFTNIVTVSRQPPEAKVE